MIFSRKNTPIGFYVYLYLRQDGTPYYVGKGKDKRAWSKLHNINLPTDERRITIVSHRLLEHESFLLEIELIKHYGRKDLGTGILRNRTNGGEGSAGHIWTDEQKMNVSGRKNPDHSKRISGKNNPNYSGHNHGHKISETMKTKCHWLGKLNPDHSKRMSGKNNPNYNKKGKDHHSFGIPRPKKQCSRCGKLCAVNLFARYHEDNCRFI